MPDNHKKQKKAPGILARFSKIFGLNIGTIMFGVLFVYMAFSGILYLTTPHIESYQVTSGPLSRNETYTGLAVREESVCKASSSGYITYYAREGSKINANGAVYGISSTKSASSTSQLSQDELSSIRNDMMSFSKSFNSSKFNNTYSFKYDLKGNILQYAESAASTAPLTSDETDTDQDSSDNTADTVEQVTSYAGDESINKAESDGIILYSVDNYEGKTVDTVTAEDFDQNSYHETDLKTSDSVKSGDDIYTIITDERWSLLIPLSDKQAEKLKDRSAIRVKFLKDDMTQTGDFSIITIDGGKYGQIDFSKGLIRYASDRFLDIELVTNTVTGLKIPLSAIESKDFYVIPAEYATTDPDSGSVGFNKISKDSSGNNVRTFINATIYGKVKIESDDDSADEAYNYYVDRSAFKEGDAIVKDDSNQRFIVGETDSLEGVYCINQGYAVFRQVDILDQNEEYAIISSNTSYGLSRYDRIARDSSQVKEQDILY